MPNYIDIHIGKRMRMARVVAGLTQEKLGKALEITFQQIQKYERGINRVSSSTLYELARYLKVPVSYFFEGLEQTQSDPHESKLESNIEKLTSNETAEILTAYYKIGNSKIRQRALDLLKVLAIDGATLD